MMNDDLDSLPRWQTAQSLSSSAQAAQSASGFYAPAQQTAPMGPPLSMGSASFQSPPRQPRIAQLSNTSTIGSTGASHLSPSTYSLSRSSSLGGGSGARRVTGISSGPRRADDLEGAFSATESVVGSYGADDPYGGMSPYSPTNPVGSYSPQTDPYAPPNTHGSAAHSMSASTSYPFHQGHGRSQSNVNMGAIASIKTESYSPQVSSQQHQSHSGFVKVEPYSPQLTGQTSHTLSPHTTSSSFAQAHPSLQSSSSYTSNASYPPNSSYITASSGQDFAGAHSGSSYPNSLAPNSNSPRTPIKSSPSTPGLGYTYNVSSSNTYAGTKNVSGTFSDAMPNPYEGSDYNQRSRSTGNVYATPANSYDPSSSSHSTFSPANSKPNDVYHPRAYEVQYGKDDVTPRSGSSFDSRYGESTLPYTQQDANAMAVDASTSPVTVDPYLPPPRKHKEGLRKVRNPADLQPRIIPPSPPSHIQERVGMGMGPLRQLTTNILDTYRRCNPNFRYESAHNPRRVLTKPSKPAHNDGHDNEDYDYILYVNDWLGGDDGGNQTSGMNGNGKDGGRYLILDILGQGTFGQVVKCQNMKTNEIVAVKVVKNKPAYFNQSMMEVTILELLNKQHDPSDEHHILRLKDSFIHHSHLCLVFELLSSNLYELIKQNNFRGLSTQLVKVFMAQLLDAMTILKDAKLIHCDLKPENILLKSLQSPDIKVIDFGSACHERQTVYTYIQSRFYRSPEVLLGVAYTTAIDMWSLGCIGIELFLGLPLFPGTSEYNQLTRIIEMLGMPPLSMLNNGKQVHQFFDCTETYNPATNTNEKRYNLKSLEQYSREHGTNEQPGKKYFAATNLPDIINQVPMPTGKGGGPAKPSDVEREMSYRSSFIDFCSGLLDLNPVTRWTPQQAKLHPFITGEKFTKPFVPNGIQLQQPQQARSSPDPKRPYGGLVPSQPKGQRAYQDAATYNHHLAQHQAYTAQAQAQAQNAFRNNPYISPPSGSQQQAGAPSSFSQSTQQHVPTKSYHQAPQPPPAAFQDPYVSHAPQPPPPQQRPQQQQNPAMQLPTVNPSQSMPSQYSNTGMQGTTYGAGAYGPPVGRTRANTINQMDQVPPALARLQHMKQDVIAGRNGLTPVMNRDDALLEWERRKNAKERPPPQPYPQLEYLQQQAELAAANGGSLNWSRYPPPPQPSKLVHSYVPSNAGAPQGIVVEDDHTRRDQVMGNVHAAAGRGDGMYGSGAAAATTLASPPQAYSGNAPPPSSGGPRYYPPQPQQDMASMYVPMQPDQYQSSTYGTNVGTQRQPPAQTQQGIPFYGPPPPQQQPPPQRNPFGIGNAPDTSNDSRRASGVDVWQLKQ